MRTSHGTHVAVPLARLGMVKHSTARGRRSPQSLGGSCSLPLCSFRPRPFCSHPERPDVPETELRSTKPGPCGPVFLWRVALLRRLQIFTPRIGIRFDLRNPRKGFAHLLIIAEVAHGSRPRRQRLVVIARTEQDVAEPVGDAVIAALGMKMMQHVIGADALQIAVLGWKGGMAHRMRIFIRDDKNSPDREARRERRPRPDTQRQCTR